MSNLLLPSQICRDIPGFEGFYYARTDGRIFSHTRLIKRNGKLVCIASKELYCFNAGYKKNYVYTRLYRDKKTLSIGVHRLVALTFCPNPENKPEVHHIDDNQSNNNYWNLQWVTKKEHMEYTRQRLCFGEDCYNSKLTEAQVIDIITSTEEVGVLAKRYGVGHSRIANIKAGITWKHLYKKYTVGKSWKTFNRQKLTEQQALEIKLSTGKSIDLSKKYFISQSVISNIRSGKTWKHLLTI